MAAVTEGDVLSALKQCYDPEIPVNIVDLGLIYAVRLESVAGGDQEARQDVSVDLTLTSPGCPSHVMIGEQVSGLPTPVGIRTVGRGFYGRDKAVNPSDNQPEIEALPG